MEWNKCVIKSGAETSPSGEMILDDEEECQLSHGRLLTL